MEPLKRRRRDVGQDLEGLGALRGREGPDHQARGLVGQGLGHRGMAMAEAGHRHAGEKIHVHVAVNVGQGGAFAVVERDSGERGNPLAAGREIVLFGREDSNATWDRESELLWQEDVFLSFHWN